MCSVCLNELQAGETYGRWEGRVVCGLCADEEWGRLSQEEKLEILGLEVKTA